MLVKLSLAVISLLFVLVLVCVQANANENELSQKLGHLLSEESQDQDVALNPYPEWLKRALPRMGKRYQDGDDFEAAVSDEVDGDADLYELLSKRALPRMGRALPRMGRALPRMGRALPRMGRALPRMG